MAAAVFWIALLLVARLVTVADDPQLARQIGWNLLFIGLSAGILAAGAAFWIVRRITLPLRRLSETMSGMARTGELQSDFPTAGGGSEVQLIEETFRGLVASLEESQRARERSYVEAVGAVVTAADARDHETTGHSFRVALYAVALAKAMGLHGEPLKAIEWGALLHDVGKMVVPDEILRKMGPLTDEEWHIMRQHPTWGFDMLAEVSFLQPAALDIIYSHHERWDGAGLPARHRRRGRPLERPHLRRGGHLRRHHLRPPLPAGAPAPGRRRRVGAGGRRSSSIRRSSRPSASCPRSSCAACASSAGASIRA